MNILRQPKEGLIQTLPERDVSRRLAQLVLAGLLMGLMFVGPTAAAAPATAASCGKDSATGDCTATSGHPINFVTGTKLRTEVDLSALPGVLGLELVRYYNSALGGPDDRPGLIGRGWRLSYEISLSVAGPVLTVHQPNGDHIDFTRRPSNPFEYLNADALQGKIIRRPTPSGDEYTWYQAGTGRLGGLRFSFNPQGRLVQIAAPSGEFTTLLYDGGGHLLQVTDPQGRSLKLHYLARQDSAGRFAGIQSIDTPVGTFTYVYGSATPAGYEGDARTLLANLVRVTYPGPDGAPGTSARIYHYDDPRFATYLTGISAAWQDDAASRRTMPASACERHDHGWCEQRIGTFAYDAQGRANLSVAGWPARLQTDAQGRPLRPARLVPGTGLEQVVLDFSVPGQTTLINALGQRSVYHHTGIQGDINGQPRVLWATGPGCSVCPASNVRYEYDAAGHFTARLDVDAQGLPLQGERFELDGWGRVRSIEREIYAHGKRAASEEIEHRRYAGLDAQGVPQIGPSLLARPSVVPGREHTVHITYNDAGQPTAVVETGYQPGFANQPQLQLQRSTTYTYQRVNGRSVLAAIDGPLPNGKTNSPGDSDVTHIQWDAGGNYVDRLVAPGEQATRVAQRDAAGRPTLTFRDDGSRYSEIHEEYSPAGLQHKQWTAWQRNAQGRLMAASRLIATDAYDYDALGRLVATQRADGTSVRMQFRADGLPTSLTLADGSEVQMQRNPNGALIAASRLDPEGRHLQTMKFDEDVAGRLLQVEDDLGVIARFEYAGYGYHPSAASDALGVRTEYLYGPIGNLQERIRAAGSVQESRSYWAYDPVGQPVALWRTTAAGPSQPDPGVPIAAARSAVYDDFGNKVVQHDAQHGFVRYVWDAANRLIAQVNESGAVTRYVYDHASRLVAQGIGQTVTAVRLRYDGYRLIERNSASLRTTWAYDALGRKISQAEAAPSTADARGRLLTTRLEQRWRYDDKGRVQEHDLIDAAGQALCTRYVWSDTTGQLLSFSLNGHTVVSDVQGSLLGGLTSYTAANGLIETFARDARGRLAAQSLHRGGRGADSHLLDAHYHYDAANRLQQIVHTIDVEDGASPPRRADVRYRYDMLGRLIGAQTGASDSTPGPTVHWAYDALGNRVSAYPASAPSADPSETHEAYRYEGQRLMSAGDEEGVSGYVYGAMGLPVLRGGLDPATTAPAAQPVSASSASASATPPHSAAYLEHLIYSPQGVLLGVSDKPSGRQVAYLYDDAGRRCAKIVTRNGFRSITQYFYEDTPGGPRLMAEADANGRITRQYLYLDETQAVPASGLTPPSRLVAVADTVSTAQLPSLNRLWHASRARVSAWFGRNVDADIQIYSVHTDWRYAPTLVTDARRRIVWRADYTAFGAARISHPNALRQASAAVWPWISDARAEPGHSPMSTTYSDDANEASASSFELNIRLPGQYYDAETGLHHNIRRQYDPRTGRYLTPDPLSQTAGMNLAQIEGASGANAYVYSGSDPINHFDAQGLYQEDIHYYMTFFLALVAGVSYDDAKIIALADQYIDNNPDTWPLDETGGLIKTAESYVGDISGAVKRLQTYHFTQYGFDPSPMVYHPTPEERAAAIAAGYPDPGPTTYEDPTLYAERRIKNPSNPQLTRLLSASNKAPTTCAQLQFFGEYLHAFEDTFGHRDQNNAPIEVNMGLGHALYGSQPDYTYNAWVLIGLPGEIGDWDTRESRTLEMEHELFDKLSSSKFATLPAKASFADIEDAMKMFNAIEENSDRTGAADAVDKKSGAGKFNQKLTLLNALLQKLGVHRPDGKDIDFTKLLQDGGEGYDPEKIPPEAINDRNNFLCTADGKRLDEAAFPGTILPKSTVPCK